LQGLSGRFLVHLLSRELAQLVVDQRQELLGCRRIALLDGGQDVLDVIHDVEHTARGCGSQPAGGIDCIAPTCEQPCNELWMTFAATL
jgi:hypothetical protein